MTGEQALKLLKGDALAEVRAVHGEDLLILVEGRVGVIERPDSDGKASTARYLEELHESGAAGVIVGGGLVDGNGYAGIREQASTLKAVT